MAALAFAIFVSAPAHAAGHDDSISGFLLGDTVANQMDILAKLGNDYNVSTGGGPYSSTVQYNVTDTAGSDKLTIVTLNDKIIYVLKSQTFPSCLGGMACDITKLMPENNMIDALHQKFGPETDSVGTTYNWQFDQSGNFIPAGSQNKGPCNYEAEYPTKGCYIGITAELYWAPLNAPGAPEGTTIVTKLILAAEDNQAFALLQNQVDQAQQQQLQNQQNQMLSNKPQL